MFGTRWAYFHHKLLVLRGRELRRGETLASESVRTQRLEYRRVRVMTSSARRLNRLRQRSGRLNRYYGRRVKSYGRKFGYEFELQPVKNLIDYFSLKLRAIRSV